MRIATGMEQLARRDKAVAPGGQCARFKSINPLYSTIHYGERKAKLRMASKSHRLECTYIGRKLGNKFDSSIRQNGQPASNGSAFSVSNPGFRLSGLGTPRLIIC
jgi:hypothetical protein